MNLGDDKSSSKSNTVAQSSTVTQAYSNPILDISGKWGDDSLCAEYMRILPSSSSQNSDLLQFAFNSRELINFRIKSIEKIPPNDYKLFIKSLDNVIEDEIIFRKLNTDRLQFFRHVRHKPEFETFIINGKDFKTEESVVTFQGCK
jgi:hypothetical protein